MSVSLYDLLDVPEDATDAEIRTAWKAAIADLDPTDRRFRAYNDAAGVLLDPEKRATYDLELAAERDDQASEDALADEPVDAAPAPVPTVELAKEDQSAPKVDLAEKPAPAADAASAPADRQGPPTWALAAAAALTVLSVALLVVVLSWPGSLGGDSPAEKEEQAAAAEEAGVSARAAADSAIPVVLGYDYRTLDQDFAEAAASRDRTAAFASAAWVGLGWGPCA